MTNDCSTVDNKNQPLTRRTHKLAAAKADPNKDERYQAATLRFTSLFSNDIGTAALLYLMPTVTNAVTYGEGVGYTNNISGGFSIVYPVIIHTLDKFINADNPDGALIMTISRIHGNPTALTLRMSRNEGCF